MSRRSTLPNYKLRVFDEDVVHEVVHVLGDDSDVTLCGVETVQLHREGAARCVRRVSGFEVLRIVERETTCLECIAHSECECPMHPRRFF